MSNLKAYRANYETRRKEFFTALEMSIKQMEDCGLWSHLASYINPIRLSNAHLAMVKNRNIRDWANLIDHLGNPSYTETSPQELEIAKAAKMWYIARDEDASKALMWKLSL